VDLAIEKGVAWLLQEQQPQGSFGPSGPDALGPTALAALALMHAGLREGGPADQDKRLTKALRFLDETGPGRAGRSDRDPGTYATSLLVLVLAARGREADLPRVQRLADLLARTQAKNGQWSYAGEPGDTGRGGPEVGDNSNTHFAVLALGTASGLGVQVPPETLARARGWWIACQAEDGGYAYSSGGTHGGSMAGSMTAAGISSLAILEAVLTPEGQRDPRVRSAMDRAVARLSDGFSVSRNEGQSGGQPGQRQRNAGRGWTHYYLWAVERALVLAGRREIGTHDWFAEGCAHLVQTQKKDGSWVEEAPLYATCFALLFLTRAAAPPRAFTPPAAPPKPVTPAAGGAPAPPAAAPPPPPLPADPRASPPLPPDELARRARAEGPASLLRLAQALDDPDPAVRRRAFEGLTALLGAERVAGADTHPLPRGRLALWLRANQRLLVIADGRFVLRT
jgi:hypothetical protein